MESKVSKESKGPLVRRVRWVSKDHRDRPAIYRKASEGRKANKGREVHADPKASKARRVRRDREATRGHRVSAGRAVRLAATSSHTQKVWSARQLSQTAGYPSPIASASKELRIPTVSNGLSRNAATPTTQEVSRQTAKSGNSTRHT